MAQQLAHQGSAKQDRVIWAMCTRCDPREGFEILRGCWTGTSDPMNYGKDDTRNARVVINACKPWSRRNSFPKVVGSSKELDQRIHAKWAHKWAHILPRDL